jgi:hypothetical protein
VHPAGPPAAPNDASEQDDRHAGGRVLGGWAERRLAEFEEQHEVRALEQQREIELLQRRIGKLSALLEEQEQQERRGRAGASAEPGVASE